MRVDSVLNVLLSECKWMADNCPQVLLGENLWKSWFNNLSEYDILNLKMNRSGIEESKDFMGKELHIREKNYAKFTCIKVAPYSLVQFINYLYRSATSDVILTTFAWNFRGSGNILKQAAESCF